MKRLLFSSGAQRLFGLSVCSIGTHVDANGMPHMVNINEKKFTTRTAVAQSVLDFPDPVAEKLVEAAKQSKEAAGGGLGAVSTKKGPVFTTAVIAATQAVKLCGNVIPFCHPLPIESCDVICETSPDGKTATVTCTVSATYKTGVEMEAIYGASVAALTVYDMLKGIPGAQPGMQIRNTRLLKKTGGKSDIYAKEVPKEQ